MTLIVKLRNYVGLINAVLELLSLQQLLISYSLRTWLLAQQRNV